MIQIGKQDLIWNYAATFLKIGSSFLLFPLILRVLPPEKVGFWAIFNTIIAFSQLLDFGFNSSFMRNVTYVFSGVNQLKVNGYQIIEKDTQINYGLLKGLISSMRWFYTRIAITYFILLIIPGTIYISNIMENYAYEKQEIYISWTILCIVSSWNLYYFYYDSLVQGRGLVKKSKQIIIIANLSYLLFATLFVISGYGLIAIVAAQAISVIIIRTLSYKVFYTKEIKLKLFSVTEVPRREIITAIYPNAVKIGLTILGGFLIQKSSIIVGSLYLSLSEIASYGISMSLIGIIAGMAGIALNTYQPKLVQLRVENNNTAIKKIYLFSSIVLMFTYFFCGSIILLFGDWVLILIGSKTLLMQKFILLIAIMGSLDQSNLTLCGNIILTKNEVPFYKASIISGIIIVIGLVISLKLLHLGLLAMVLIPLIVNLSYQSWKWPSVIYRELVIDN